MKITSLRSRKAICKSHTLYVSAMGNVLVAIATVYSPMTLTLERYINMNACLSSKSFTSQMTLTVNLKRYTYIQMHAPVPHCLLGKWCMRRSCQWLHYRSMGRRRSSWALELTLLRRIAMILAATCPRTHRQYISIHDTFNTTQNDEEATIFFGSVRRVAVSRFIDHPCAGFQSDFSKASFLNSSNNEPFHRSSVRQVPKRLFRSEFP